MNNAAGQWNPYPSVKPEKSDMYLVFYENGTPETVSYGVEVDEWLCSQNVIAWAEIYRIQG